MTSARMLIGGATLLLAARLEAQAVTPAPAPPPPAPPAAAARPVVVPEAAVALCGDGSFVVAPDSAASCGTRGGLRLRFMGPRVAPPRPLGQPADAEARAATPAVEAQVPAGATLRCKDGTYLGGSAEVARCAPYGGSGVVLPRVATPPAPPRTP